MVAAPLACRVQKTLLANDKKQGADCQQHKAPVATLEQKVKCVALVGQPRRAGYAIMHYPLAGRRPQQRPRGFPVAIVQGDQLL